MNTQEFYNKITISKTEIIKSNYYLKYRGLQEHIIILNYLENVLKRKIRYSEIATTFRYDKRIRTVIYKYIGFIEEYLRAIISNNYPDDIPESIKIYDYKKLHINGNKTYDTVSDMLFSSLVKQFNKMNNTIISSSFNNYRKEYMEYVIDLRNAVSHNRFLLNYDSFHNKSCLKENIKILYSVLPDFLQDNFVNELNACQNPKPNKKENQTDWDLPKSLIINL